MTWTVVSTAKQCPWVALDVGRCVLAEGHGIDTMKGHVSAWGHRFAESTSLRTDKQVPVGPIEAFQRDLVTGAKLHEVATDIRNSVNELRAKVLSEAEKSRNTWEWTKAEIHSLRHDADSAVSPGVVDGLQEQVTKLAREVGRLNQELVATRSERKRQRRADDETFNRVNMRLNTLERDLRNTHELAERNRRCEHARDRAQMWNADSAEPPRDQIYVDDSGSIWKYFDDRGGWNWTTQHRFDAEDLEFWREGVYRPWSAIQKFSAADFPWRMRTNGAQ